MRVDPRVPMAVGLGGCAVTVAVAVAPLVAADPARAAVLRTYYRFGVGGLWIAIAIAAVLGLVLLAGLTGRADPVLVASVGVGAGVVLGIATTLWGLQVPANVVTELGTSPLIRHHRWLTVASAWTPAVAAAWLAWHLGLLR